MLQYKIEINTIIKKIMTIFKNNEFLQKDKTLKYESQIILHM